MWYLRKVASSCEQFGTVSPCLFPKFWKENFMHFRHKYVETWNQSNFLISKVSHVLNVEKE